MRRCSRTGERASLAGYGAHDYFLFHLPATDGDERAHDGAHHVAQESIGAGLDFDERAAPTLVVALCDFKLGDSPDARLRVRLSRRKGSPIMLTQKEKRGLSDSFYVKRPRFVQRIAAPERRHDARIEDSVDI